MTEPRRRRPPDDKDWTWVLERPCPDCGFDASTIGPDDFAPLTRGYVTRLRDRLNAPDAAARPEPTVWSPAEYAAHVRDVCRVFGARLGMMRGHHDPLFANWDQDETALVERYWEQPVTLDPDRARARERAVRRRPRDAAPRTSSSRPGRRSNGSVFTVDSLARYFLHDLAHHVHDVGA